MVLKVIMAIIVRSDVFKSFKHKKSAKGMGRIPFQGCLFFCWNEILGMLKYSEMLFMAIARIGEEIIEML